MGAHGTTQECAVPETSSPQNCPGPDSSAGSSQQPPILLMGDPIGDQGYARLSTRLLLSIRRLPGQRISKRRATHIRSTSE
nr:unnamed protein product [Haemonchus contortus]